MKAQITLSLLVLAAHAVVGLKRSTRNLPETVKGMSSKGHGKAGMMNLSLPPTKPSPSSPSPVSSPTLSPSSSTACHKGKSGMSRKSLSTGNSGKGGSKYHEMKSPSIQPSKAQSSSPTWHNTTASAQYYSYKKSSKSSMSSKTSKSKKEKSCDEDEQEEHYVTVSTVSSLAAATDTEQTRSGAANGVFKMIAFVITLSALVLPMLM